MSKEREKCEMIEVSKEKFCTGGLQDSSKSKKRNYRAKVDTECKHFKNIYFLKMNMAVGKKAFAM